MIQGPLQKLFIIHRAVRNGKADLDQFILAAINDDAVQFQKGQHCHNTNALIAIYKRMILYQ